MANTMKSALVSGFFALTAVALFAATPGIVADPDGLIGAWDFRDAASGIVCDYSVNGNPGRITPNDGAAPKDTLAKHPESGRDAFLGDGSTRMVKIPGIEAYTTQDFTVEINCRINKLPADTGSKRQALFIFNNTKLRLWINSKSEIAVDSEAETLRYFYTSPVKVEVGKDLHIVCTVADRKEITMTVNGQRLWGKYLDPVKKSLPDIIIGGDPFRLDRFVNAYIWRVALYNRALSEQEISQLATRKSFRPGPARPSGIYEPKEKAEFVGLDGVKAPKNPSVKDNTYTWKTPEGTITRTIKRIDPAPFQAAIKEFAQAPYPAYCQAELQRLLQQRDYTTLAAVMEEFKSLKHLFQEALDYDAMAKREISEELKLGKPGYMPPIHMDLTTFAPLEANQRLLQQEYALHTRMFLMQGGVNLDLDFQLSDLIRKHGCKVALFGMPHIPKKDIDKWSKEHPELKDRAYFYTLRTAQNDGSLRIPLDRPCYEVDPLKYYEVLDRTTGKELTTSEWTLDRTRGSVTIPNAQASHDYVVFYFTEYRGHLSGRIRASFPNQQQEDHYVKIFTEKCQQFNGKLHLLHSNGVYPYGEGSLFKYWDNQSYCRVNAAPPVQEAYEKATGRKFRPHILFPHIARGPAINVTPTEDYLAWMKFNQDNFNRYMKRIAQAAKDNGIVYQMYWGDQHIGFAPNLEGLTGTGIGSVVRPLQGSADLRGITGTPSNAYKAGRLDWIFTKGVNDPSFLKLLLHRWHDNKRGQLFKVQDHLYWSEVAVVYNSNAGVRQNLFESLIKRINEEYLLMYKYLHNQQVYTNPINVYFVNEWGNIYAWFPWSDRMLHHFSDIPVNIRFISFKDIASKGIPADSHVLVTYGTANTSWNGTTGWQLPGVKERIVEYVNNGGGLMAIGLGALEQGKSLFKIGNPQLKHFSKESGYNLRQANIGKGRMVSVYGEKDPRFSMWIKEALFSAANQTAMLKNLYFSNPAVVPYAYPATKVLAIHNDSTADQKGVLQFNPAIMGLKGDFQLRNLLTNKIEGKFTAQQLAAGIPMEFYPTETKYFKVEE